MEDAIIVSTTVQYGNQHWRRNADGSYSALAFGSFPYGGDGLRYGWISVGSERVPKEVLRAIEGGD